MERYRKKESKMKRDTGKQCEIVQEQDSYRKQKEFVCVCVGEREREREQTNHKMKLNLSLGHSPLSLSVSGNVKEIYDFQYKKTRIG